MTATVHVADFFLGSHACNFNSLTTHVNEQLVCLLPVEILKLCGYVSLGRRRILDILLLLLLVC